MSPSNATHTASTGTIPNSKPISTGDPSPFEIQQKQDLRKSLGRLIWKKGAMPQSPHKPDAKPWKKYGVLVVLTGGAFWSYHTMTAKHADSHLTTKVKKGPFDVVVVETGELQAEKSVSITT